LAHHHDAPGGADPAFLFEQSILSRLADHNTLSYLGTVDNIESILGIPRLAYTDRPQWVDRSRMDLWEAAFLVETYPTVKYFGIEMLKRPMF
jgi:hypothetical protein